jgi:hypothetical protein
MLMSDSALKPLMPEFVITSAISIILGLTLRDCPTGSGQIWEKRRRLVRDGLTPVFDFLEQKNITPVDNVACDVLKSFDPDGVHLVWNKALERRHTDAEGTITSSWTLIEYVCKHVLDETGRPALYRAVATTLNIAPASTLRKPSNEGLVERRASWRSVIAT